MSFRKLKQQCKPSWRDLSDGALSPYANMVNFIDQFVWLPDRDIQMPIVATYLLNNSAWADEMPYLFSFGKTHSGKSTLATLCSLQRGLDALQASSSAKGVRNVINMGRFPNRDDDFDEEETEVIEADGFMLIWDNVNLDTFADEVLYNIFLCGAQLATDKYVVADRDGGVVTYHTFSPKIFSSVFPVHKAPKLTELKSRCLIIFHGRPDDEDRHFDRPNDYSWDAWMRQFYLPIYESISNQGEYISFHKEWNRCRKWPATISHHRRSKLADLAATGKIIGAWDSTEKARAIFADYFEYLDGQTADEHDPLIQQLASLLGDMSSIKQVELKGIIKLKLDNGRLLENPSAGILQNAMLALGFTLLDGIWLKK